MSVGWVKWMEYTYAGVAFFVNGATNLNQPNKQKL